MPRVYITQETNYDFTNAESFGDIVFVTRDDLNNMKQSLHNEGVLKQIRARLHDFDYDLDWLVIAGSPYITAAVFAILGRKGAKKLNILRWSNRDRFYIPMHLNLETYGEMNHAQ